MRQEGFPMPIDEYPSLAQSEDAEEIFALLWASRESIPLADEFNNPATVDWLRASCEAGEWQVIRRGIDIAAVIKMVAHEIKYVVVREGHRRQGLGGAMLTFAKGHCVIEGYSSLRAEVHEKNADSRAMLQAAGFDFSCVGAKPCWQVYEWKCPDEPADEEIE
jgi:GNAT superfamily N-acetyltransferase